MWTSRCPPFLVLGVPFYQYIDAQIVSGQYTKLRKMKQLSASELAIKQIEERRSRYIPEHHHETYEEERRAVIARARIVMPVELIPVESLGLSKRANYLFQERDIHTVLELITHSREDLLITRNCGKKTIDEIEHKLHEMGLQLAEKPYFT